MHPPLAASNAYVTTRVHQMTIQQWHAATTRHSYALTYQFLTDLQTFGLELLRDIQFGLPA